MKVINIENIIWFFSAYSTYTLFRIISGLSSFGVEIIVVFILITGYIMKTVYHHFTKDDIFKPNVNTILWGMFLFGLLSLLTRFDLGEIVLGIMVGLLGGYFAKSSYYNTIAPED